MDNYIKLNLPVTEQEIRKFKIGDQVKIYGFIVTARDMAHKQMVEEKPNWLNTILNNGCIYHCGPVMKKQNDKWTVISAGPTTSIREEPYEADVIKNYKVRVILGKGGMGEKTSSALKEIGACYIHLVGGAGVYIADFLKEIKEVYMLDKFGIPEAYWVMKAEGLPGVVSMDSTGNSLHRSVETESKIILDRLI